jgi:hypothetical protein
MPLNITKVAFGITSVDHLAERIAVRAAEGGFTMTTRYLPKRHAEIVGGSLFWIFKHQLIARTPIIGFGEADGGRVAIHLEPVLRLVVPRGKRAHQGWRYLEHADAPADLGGDADGAAALPPALAGELSALGLI